MKKISLKNLNLKEVEQLSREQLRNVLGGFTGSSDEGTGEGTEEDVECNCNNKSDCPTAEGQKPQDCKATPCTANGKAGVCGWDGTAG